MTAFHFDTSDLSEAFSEPLRAQLKELDGKEANAESLSAVAQTLQESGCGIGLMVTKDNRIVIDKAWRFA